MSQYNLKNEVDLNNQNLDGISPRLASALGKLHTAIDELKKNRDLSESQANDTANMADEIKKLNSRIILNFFELPASIFVKENENLRVFNYFGVQRQKAESSAEKPGPENVKAY